MGSRKLIVVASVVIGLFAAVALVGYVRSLERDKKSANEARTAWVVTEEIPKGTPIKQALLYLKKETRSGVPLTAITDPETEIDSSYLAASDLPVGQVLVSGNFASPAEAGSGLSSLLDGQPDDLVSVSVSLSDLQNAGGLIEPGDYVNVLTINTPSTPFWGTKDQEEVTFQDLSKESLETLITNAASNRLLAAHVPKQVKDIVGVKDDKIPSFTELDDNQKKALIDWVAANERFALNDALSQKSTRYLVQKVKVLAVNQTLVKDIGEPKDEEENAGGDGTGGVITLAVAPEYVQVILNATQGGENNVYLSVVPPDYEPRPLPVLDPSMQVAPGEDLSQLTNENVRRSLLSSVGGATPETLTFTQNADNQDNKDNPEGEGNDQ